MPVSSICSGGMLQARSFATKPSAAMIKQLRGMTGSPLKDCMKVLAETDGDFDRSKELLRKRGLAAAEKRSDRLATEGLIGLNMDEANNTVTMIQLACETDFVARTEKFREGVSAIMDAIHTNEAIAIDSKRATDAAFLEKLCKEHHLPKSLDPSDQHQTIEASIKYTASKTQENCQLVRAVKTTWDPQKGQVIHSYLHNKDRELPTAGKIGAIFVSSQDLISFYICTASRIWRQGSQRVGLHYCIDSGNACSGHEA